MFGVAKEWNIDAVFSSGECDVELAQFFGFLVLQSRLTFGALGLKEKPVFLVTDEIISPCITIDETEGKDDVEFKSFAHMDCHDGHRVRVGKGTPVNIFKGKEKFKNFWKGGFCLGLVVKKDFAKFKVVGMGIKVGGGIEIAEGFLQRLGFGKCSNGSCKKLYICKFGVVMYVGKKPLYRDFGRTNEGFKKRAHKGKGRRECEGFCAFGLCGNSVGFEIGF